MQELSGICAAIFSYELNSPSIEKPTILDGLISSINSENVCSLISSNNSLFAIIFFSRYNFSITLEIYDMILEDGHFFQNVLLYHQ